MNWMDILIIIILIANILEGINRGLIVSLFNLVSIFIAAYTAKLYFPILSGYIYNNPHFLGKIKDYVYARVYAIIETIQNPESPGSILDLFKLPQPVKEGIMKNPELHTYSNDVVYSTGNILSQSLTATFINIISIIVIFFVVRVLLAILVGILDQIAHLPILKQFNKTAGFVFGIAKGVLIIYVIFTILTPVISMYPDGIIAKGTFESVLGQYFYSNNIIINYLESKNFIL